MYTLTFPNNCYAPWLLGSNYFYVSMSSELNLVQWGEACKILGVS